MVAEEAGSSPVAHPIPCRQQVGWLAGHVVCQWWHAEVAPDWTGTRLLLGSERVRVLLPPLLVPTRTSRAPFGTSVAGSCAARGWAHLGFIRPVW